MGLECTRPCTASPWYSSARDRALHRLRRATFRMCGRQEVWLIGESGASIVSASPQLILHPRHPGTQCLYNFTACFQIPPLPVVADYLFGLHGTAALVEPHHTWACSRRRRHRSGSRRRLFLGRGRCRGHHWTAYVRERGDLARCHDQRRLCRDSSNHFLGPRCWCCLRRQRHRSTDQLRLPAESCGAGRRAARHGGRHRRFRLPFRGQRGRRAGWWHRHR